MKRFFALFVAFFLGFSLVACNDKTPGYESDKESDTGVTTPREEEIYMDSGIILTDSLSFEARSDAERLNKEIKLERISRLEGDYVRREGNYTFLSLSAPQIEVGGISHNEGTLARLPSDLVAASKYYENSSGVTVRFATSAREIRILATFKDSYKSNTTVPRGSYGIDVYIGSGTDRDYLGERMQKMTGMKLDETITLPGGVTEVLINLPLLADIVSFEIGFRGASAGIALPLERDRAPIVFYGGALTQGLSASRPGNAYANIVGRMLNVDTVNLGSLKEARGDLTIAEHIARIRDIAAFVMELDDGATADELRANHYNFYNTVRDAHPDIPIIIMTTPTYSDEAISAASERREVITETYKKALESGDRLVYLLDTNDTFPHTDDLLDLYTGDMKTASDTGMYAVALGVYDVLNSAFTPDEEKSGVKRNAGGLEKLSFAPENRADELGAGDYVKVSDVDSEYVISSNEDATFLSISAPCFTFGGIAHPDDNGGEYHRFDVTKREYLLEQLKGKSSDNLVSSGYDQLMKHLSAGTLRFRTNASEIIVRISYGEGTKGATHFSLRGATGIDIYVGSGTERYYAGDAGRNFTGNSISETVKLPGGYTEVLINLPLYGGIKKIQIGFTDENAEVAPALDRAISAPIVLYGASIEQGACASRPGLSSTALLSRMLDVDIKSLACSGLGWADLPMAEYIADLEMSVLLLSPSSGDFPDRIYDFYKIVREKNPDLPIVYFGSARMADEWEPIKVARDSVLKAQYERAVAEGDKNVYYVEVVPEVIVDNNRDLLSVDFCHPNDLGFYYTADSLYEALVEILKK